MRKCGRCCGIQTSSADDESATYRVEDKGVDGEGACVLTTSVDTEPGRTTLERDCTKDPPLWDKMCEQQNDMAISKWRVCSYYTYAPARPRTRLQELEDRVEDLERKLR